MTPDDRPSQPEPDPVRAVGLGVQNLVAARLGRAFIPLAILFGWGVVSVTRGGAPWVALGAVLTSAAMLAFGQRAVQRAFGRPHRPWMTLAGVGAVLPWMYGVFLVGWRGLRSVAAAGDATSSGFAIASVALGVWVLHSWLKIIETDRLARMMTIDPDEGGSA